MKLYVILDLDGCIADDRWRLSQIDRDADDPYKHYADGCLSDPLINSPIARLADDYEIIIFTARSVVSKKDTLKWLREVAFIEPYVIYMRPEGCKLSSPALKAAYLMRLISRGIKVDRDIAFAVDDRLDVLDMYRTHGLRTLRVDQHTHRIHIGKES